MLRSETGWWLVSDFTRSADTLRFRLHSSKQAAPSGLDRRIIQRAAAMLATEAKWDRADDRVCAPTDTTWSIYCALAQASIEVAGAFHHRRPAMELVRIIVA